MVNHVRFYDQKKKTLHKLKIKNCYITYFIGLLSKITNRFFGFFGALKVFDYKRFRLSYALVSTERGLAR